MRHNDGTLPAMCRRDDGNLRTTCHKYPALSVSVSVSDTTSVLLGHTGPVALIPTREPSALSMPRKGPAA